MDKKTHREATIADMVGRVFLSVDGRVDGEELIFIDSGGDKFVFHHRQGCCERVYIESIVGDLSDLCGSPLLLAEESVTVNHSYSDNQSEFPCNDSCTWTFYKFATIKGYVDVRWLGESNGYYSESVDLKGPDIPLHSQEG